MFKSKSVVQPLILATVLGLGFTSVWCILLVWIADMSSDRQHSRQGWKQFYLQSDGTPLIQSAGGFHDVTGKPVADTNVAVRVLHGVQLETGSDAPVEVIGPQWDRRIRAFTDSAQPANIWYFICDGAPHGSAYLVGYNEQTNARIGFITKTGFRKDEPPVEDRFPFDGGGGPNVWCSGITRRVLSPQNPYGPSLPGSYIPWPQASDTGPFGLRMVFVQADNEKLYQIDLDLRAVGVFLENERIRSMNWTHDLAAYEKVTGLAVRTDSGVLLFRHRNEVARRFPLPQELRDKSFNWDVTTNGTPVIWTAGADLLREKTQTEVYWLDAAGRITRQQEFTLSAGEGAAQLRYMVGWMAPAPALQGALLAVGWPLTLFGGGLARTWPEAWINSLDAYWPSLAVASVVGIVLAGICYRREARYGASLKERILWPLFVFAFGLGGWIGYRFARSWPILAGCPTCGASVPRDRMACAACQAEFPQPALKGTEVFA